MLRLRFVSIFLAISPATTLTLARVFALAAVVRGFATAFALAGILALASVLFLHLVFVRLFVLALVLSAE